MAGRIARALDLWHLRKLQDRWTRAVDAAPELDGFELRALRAEARGLRRTADRLIRTADDRLALPLPGAGLPRMPLGTDVAWRPDAWRAPLLEPGQIALGARTEIAEGLALYHDCPLGEVSVRQRRNRSEGDRAPMGLVIEVFGFRGGFLSLAINLPQAAVDGLQARHLLRIDAVIDSDRPLRGFARLNVKHGPNVSQLVSDLPEGDRTRLAEFDLAYAGIDTARVESAWLDLIFNDAAMAQITICDVVVGRRPRAEL